MSRQSQIKRRDREFSRHPYCHWCGVLLSHPQEYLNDDGKLKNVKYHMATLDHLDGRLSGERGKWKGSWRTVLSCVECNQWRCMLDQLRVGVEELRRLSKQH